MYQCIARECSRRMRAVVPNASCARSSRQSGAYVCSTSTRRRSAGQLNSASVMCKPRPQRLVREVEATSAHQLDQRHRAHGGHPAQVRSAHMLCDEASQQLNITSEPG